MFIKILNFDRLSETAINSDYFTSTFIVTVNFLFELTIITILTPTITSALTLKYS